MAVAIGFRNCSLSRSFCSYTYGWPSRQFGAVITIGTITGRDLSRAILVEPCSIYRHSVSHAIHMFPILIYFENCDSIVCSQVSELRFYLESGPLGTRMSSVFFGMHLQTFKARSFAAEHVGSAQGFSSISKLLVCLISSWRLRVVNL